MLITSQEWSGLALAGGRYRVTAKLGEGGMGFVYRALDQNIDADVVIKVPRQAMMEDPEFVGRFTREIRSLVKLSHPHIVKVTDVGSYDGIPFAVMQYLAGGSLEDQRPVGPAGQVLPCDPRTVSRWLLAVAESLDYIHTQGYVHRDVKPGNILFDTQGHAFLSDFGVAKVLASGKNPAPSQTAMTGAGMVLGTPEYMAPELIMGDQFDGKVDQYALAITVYELLCGRRPFEDETKTRVLVLHTTQAPSPLTAWSPKLPARLSQAVLKGLAKEPSGRYPNCVALAKAVAAAADNSSGQDDRIRLKCSSCGKTGSIPAADLARLKAGGGRATCPACKSPIDIGNAAQVAPGATTGGTMAFSIAPGTVAEYGLAPPEQGPVSGNTAAFTSGGLSGGHARSPSPSSPRSGTMAISSQDRNTPPPVPGHAGTSPRAASGTIIERAVPRSDHTEASRDIFNTLDTAGAQFSGALTKQEPAADKTRMWIAVGAAVAAGLLMTAGTAFFFVFISRKDSGSSINSSADARPQPPTKDLSSQSSPSPPQIGVDTLAKMTPKKARPGPNSKVARGNQPRRKDATEPPQVKRELAANNEVAAEPASRPTPIKKGATPKTKPSQPPAPSGMFASGQFDLARMPKKPRQPNKYSAGKNLAKAKSLGDSFVIPDGIYRFKRSSDDDPAGTRKYSITECSVQPKRGGALELIEYGSSVLEVEPRLAFKLDKMPADFLAESVAILTLWINNSGQCAVVAAELLEECKPRLKPGFGIGQADVDYHVVFLSPQAVNKGKAPDEDWQKVGRMSHFYLQWKHYVDGLRKRQQTATMASLTNTMGSMYASAMRGAAADAAAERGRQRAISGH